MSLSDYLTRCTVSQTTLTNDKGSLLKIALHQMSSGIDAHANADVLSGGIHEASNAGAQFYFAPEMSGLIDKNRIRAALSIGTECNNPVLLAAQKAAAATGVWVHIGSIPVRYEHDNSRFANRSIVINGAGVIVSRYDKMHLFDVQLSAGEHWRESDAYRAGDHVVVAETPLGKMGMTICYDLRFPDLFSYMARSGACIFAVPAAFTVPTGQAHWHTLLKARAIESACFVIAAAQCGTHADGRQTYGHSLVIDPWGDVLLDMGKEEGLGFATLNLGRIDEVRGQIPVHLNRRDIGAPRAV